MKKVNSIILYSSIIISFLFLFSLFDYPGTFGTINSTLNETSSSTSPNLSKITTQNNISFSNYEDKDRIFQIQYPSDWELLNGNSKDHTVIGFKPKNLDIHLRGPLKVLRRKEIMKENGLSFPILVDSENNDGIIVGLVDAVIYLKSKLSGNDPVLKKNFIIVEEEASKEAILGFASTGYPIIVRSNRQYFKFDLESFFAHEKIS